MIHLLDIQLENFMSIESLEMTFDANEVIIISGDNGSGKSALISAIALALISYRKGESYKDFIRTGSDNAKVLLHALYKGEPITFDITLKNVKYGTPLTRKITYQGTTYVNSDGLTLLKSFDTEYLEHVMFLFQGDNSIVDLKPGERAKLLKKLFHFEFDAQVQDLNTRLDSESSLYAATSIRLEEASKQLFKPLDLLDPDDHDYATELAIVTDKISKSIRIDEAAIYQLADDAKAVEAKVQRYELLKARTVESISRRNSAIRGFKNVAAPQKDPPWTSKERFAAFEELQAAQKEANETSTRRALLGAELATLQEQLKVASTGVCHACGQTVDSVIASRLEYSIRELEGQLGVAIVDSSRQLKLQKKVDQIDAALGDYEASIREYAFLKEKIDQTKIELESDIAALNQHEEELEAAKQQLSLLNTQLVDSQETLEEAKELKRLHARANELQLAIDQQKRIITINEERSLRNKEIAKAEAAHIKTIQELAGSLATIANNIETLKKAISIFEIEFPNFIILQTCSHIEAHINEFIQRIFPYMKVRLSQNRGGVDFYYTASSSEDDWLSVKMASGAQAAILSLAWRVAIAKLYGITTLLLDEVDAESTDENSKLIYEFICSLDGLFNQIILISHRKDALRTVASLADNVTCYEVSDGVYSEITDPEYLD